MADPVILVHGTFAGPKQGAPQWYQPDSEFCVALDRALAARGVQARCWSGLADYFHWGPGDNTWVARSEAAQKLRELVRKLDDTCHIVAHSHGGNVVLEALGWEAGSPPSWFDGTVTLLGTPLIVPGRRQKSYTALYLIALLLAFGAGIALTPALYTWWSVALPLVLVFVFVAVVTVKTFEIFGDGFKIFGGPDATLLLINSPRDEAYQLLSALTTSPNPLLTDKRRPLCERFEAAIHECWLVAKSSCQLTKGRFSWVVVGILVFLPLSSMTLLLGVPVSRFYAYWAVIGAMTAAVLLAFQRSVIDSMVYTQYLLNVVLVFLAKFVKYPFARMATGVAKRMSWPLVKAYALGLVDSPTPIGKVRIELRPARGDHQYKDLPEEIAADAIAKRNRSAQAEVMGFIEAVSNSEWSIETVRQCLRELNEPGLVHSCYYGLDHPWVIDAIAAHIESYHRAMEKEAADFEKGTMDELNYGRD